MIPTSRPRRSRRNTRSPLRRRNCVCRSALAHWIAFLKKNGAYDNAIIIVTGDHGEGLGEHGEETHGLFLYDSTLHIPLIVKLPSKSASKSNVQRGTVVDSEVRTTDILPTILSAAKVPAPAELNGESVLPLIEKRPDNQAPPNHTLFGETDYSLRGAGRLCARCEPRTQS